MLTTSRCSPTRRSTSSPRGVTTRSTTSGSVGEPSVTGSRGGDHAHQHDDQRERARAEQQRGGERQGGPDVEPELAHAAVVAAEPRDEGCRSRDQQGRQHGGGRQRPEPHDGRRGQRHQHDGDAGAEADGGVASQVEQRAGEDQRGGQSHDGRPGDAVDARADQQSRRGRSRRRHHERCLGGGWLGRDRGRRGVHLEAGRAVGAGRDRHAPTVGRRAAPSRQTRPRPPWVPAHQPARVAPARWPPDPETSQDRWGQ